MSRIYTRQGDHGQTRLGTGEKVSKHHVRVAAYGSLYELNSMLGHARALLTVYRPHRPDPLWTQFEAFLTELMHQLFMVGHDLSGGHKNISVATQETDTQILEQWIDHWRSILPPWKPFTLPEGSIPGTALYQATTVCRRAEREIYRLNQEEPVDRPVLMFVNRLSDFLFMAARYVNEVLGASESAVRNPRLFPPSSTS
ncbi:MAG: cob(I)yrinic acid a,c-diamide adenosyltransferase [Sulfobacillus sp.]|nr:cob(I)yrinic acid a,c-diamide adenosyltransferase [Sulfobacillus sp.]